MSGVPARDTLLSDMNQIAAGSAPAAKHHHYIPYREGLACRNVDAVFDAIITVEKVMETITVESIPIVVGREEDGRWWADIESMPGVMAYGATRESAIAAVRALALRVAADCIDHGEEIPEPFTKVFSVG
jgi:predicted RNase H-like HicB family nuclease